MSKRVLKFIVDNQIITKDPTCDFSGLVPGSEGFLEAEFKFSSVWDGCAKVAGFYSPLGQEYQPQPLLDGKSCIIPPEALKRQIFKIRLFGAKPNFNITTNKVAVSQDGDISKE